MRRTLRSAAVLLGSLALLAPAAPAHAALQPLVVKTVTIGGKHVRFVLGVEDEKGYVVMKLRKNGHWRAVARKRTDCNYWDGSSEPQLQVQKADKQVLVTWLGPNPEEGAAEYGGYDVKHQTLEMYGAETCPAAG